jgi:hypothetical protein
VDNKNQVNHELHNRTWERGYYWFGCSTTGMRFMLRLRQITLLGCSSVVPYFERFKEQERFFGPGFGLAF